MPAGHIIKPLRETARTVRRFVNGVIYNADPEHSDLLWEFWSGNDPDYDAPYEWVDQLYQTQGGAYWRMESNDFGSEDTPPHTITPLNYNQALTFLATRVDIETLERLFGPQPDACSEAGREIVSVLLTPAEKTRILATGKTMTDWVNEQIQTGLKTL